MAGVSRYQQDRVEDVEKRVPHAAEDHCEFIAHVILGRRHGRSQDPIGIQCRREFPEELARVESVQLRRRWVRNVHDRHIVAGGGALDEEPGVREVDRDPGIRETGNHVISEAPAGLADEIRVELHVVDSLDARVLEDLGDRASQSATKKKDSSGRRVLEHRQVNGLLGGETIR